MIDTITINSLLTGFGSDYHLINAEGFESPSVDYALTPKSGRHGTVLHKALWRSRRLRLEYAMSGATKADYGILRKNLLKAYALPVLAATSTMYFTTTDGLSLQVDVNNVLNMEGGFTPGHVTTGRIRIELIAPDPNFYGQSVNEQTMYPPVAGGVELPATLPLAFASTGGSYTVNNAGNGIVYPTIKIYGPCTNVNVRNNTTGDSFVITPTISAGNYVEVDLSEQTVLLNGSTNYLQYFTGDFLYLKAGNNTITFSSDENDASSYAELSWRNAYIGI